MSETHVRNRLINIILSYIKEDIPDFKIVDYDNSDTIEVYETPALILFVDGETVNSAVNTGNRRLQDRETTLSFICMLELDADVNIIKFRDTLVMKLEQCLSKNRERTSVNGLAQSLTLRSYDSELIEDVESSMTSFRLTYTLSYRTLENDVTKTDREI